ncbi:MAG: Pseudouridine synthase [candidate division TM6 bacterium GW2011_GWF2_30_66]|nr:MAG: Pseudouridine synthase [candidate division TM6 bacterium GW2011_GWF2_30_66]
MGNIKLENSNPKNLLKTNNIKLENAGSIHKFTVKPEEENLRIDTFITNQFKSYSRSFFEKLIELELVKINNKIINKKSWPIKENDIIELQFPEEKNRDQELNKLKDLEINIVYQNQHFAILNKPANLAAHPSNNNTETITLVDWIIANIEQISNVGFDSRPGIVHRLDKDTTGLMIIPKNNCSHAYFADLFKKRKIEKSYLAIVHGHPEKTGEIDIEIARHPREKTKMTHVTSSNIAKIKGKSRNAKTMYEVLEYYDGYALVLAKPLTGRTHQIRVHFCSIGHPLLGDAVYGKSSKIMARHALHAFQLEFEFEDKKMKFEQEPPKDFINAISFLKQKKS